LSFSYEEGAAIALSAVAITLMPHVFARLESGARLYSGFSRACSCQRECCDECKDTAIHNRRQEVINETVVPSHEQLRPKHIYRADFENGISLGLSHKELLGEGEK
jgi:hypothetical protein